MKKFHPAFLVFTIVLLFCGYGVLFLTYLGALILHELAHSIVAKKLGYKLKNFYLTPFGALLEYQDIFWDNDELKIAIAGPAMSLTAGFLTVALWWIFPNIYQYTLDFALANFVLAIFNFLPAFPLDGARVIINLLSEKMPRKKALKITIFINYFLSALFLIFFIVSIFISINFNFLIIAIFLFLAAFDGYFQGKYIPICSMDKSKYLKKGTSVKVFAFSHLTPLYKILKIFSQNKYNIFYIVYENGETKVISEDNLKKVFENYNLNLSFSDIYNGFDK